MDGHGHVYVQEVDWPDVVSKSFHCVDVHNQSCGSTILHLKNIGLHLILIFIYILCYLV